MTKGDKALRRQRKKTNKAANKLASVLGNMGLTETSTTTADVKMTAVKKKKKTKKASKYNEQKEFELAYKSLTERERNAVIKSARSRNNKTKTKKERLKLKKATFVTEDSGKSTQQLMEEATRQVDGLGGIGLSSRSGKTTTATTRTSLLGAPPRTAQATPQKNLNPFMILEDDSDDGDKGNLSSTAATFQLAPPSFAMPANIGNIDHNDPDPDL